MAVRLTRTNWVASTAIALIAVQLVIRAILAFKGYFYWDDLILVGRAGTQGLFSPTLPLRRPRRSRHARSVPRRRRDHPPRSAELDRPSHQPRRPATAGIPRTLAGPPRHPRLAARPPHPADVRPLHATRHSRIRLVGSRIELAADARRHGMGMRRRHLAGPHRQSALRRHRTSRLLRRPALLREGRRHSVRRLHDHRPPRPRHRRRVRPAHGLASRDQAVGRLARADRRLDRPLPRRRRPGALEPRPTDDARPVEPLHHSRHRSRTRRRPVGLAALGSRLAVGDTTRHRHGARLAGARRGGRRVVSPQGAHRHAVGRRRRLRDRLSDPDLPHAVVSKFTALELAQTLRYLPDLVVVLALLAAVGFCAPNRPDDPDGSTPPRRVQP